MRPLTKFGLFTIAVVWVATPLLIYVLNTTWLFPSLMTVIIVWVVGIGIIMDVD